MAVKAIQVTQSGSAIQIATVATYARWIIFQNTGAATMTNGDAGVTAANGDVLQATGAANNNTRVLPPMPDGAHYDLSQWWTIGTSTQKLNVIYDAMN